MVDQSTRTFFVSLPLSISPSNFLFMLPPLALVGKLSDVIPTGQSQPADKVFSSMNNVLLLTRLYLIYFLFSLKMLTKCHYLKTTIMLSKIMKINCCLPRIFHHSSDQLQWHSLPQIFQSVQTFSY